MLHQENTFHSYILYQQCTQVIPPICILMASMFIPEGHKSPLVTQHRGMLPFFLRGHRPTKDHFINCLWPNTQWLNLVI